jgi:methionyl-tRNA formyltransferase
MRLLFVGSKDRGARCLEALVDAGREVIGVVTEPDDDPDAFWDRSVADTATEFGIDHYIPGNVNDPDFLETVRNLDPDLVTMSGFSQILEPEFLDIPQHGVVNLHAGKLPDYRGGSPMNWAIINGETMGTATIHYATERIDAGGVLAEREFDIGWTDTIADVRDRTLDLFPEMLVNVVDEIEAGTQSVREFDVSNGTYWGSRLPQDGRIGWTHMSATQVYNFVRSLTHPYPGAFTTYEGERLYVWEASPIDDEVRHTPGRVCMRRDGGRVVTAGDRGLLLETVQRAGGTQRPAPEVVERGEYLG